MPQKPKPDGAQAAAEYRFKIDAYSPETMPMARLAEYMAGLAQLLGEPAAVHFKRLEGGSTVLVHNVEQEAAPIVRQRLAGVRRGDGAPDALRAFKMLNKYLRDNNAVGVLKEKRKAAVVLSFPGRLEPQESYFAVRQHGSVDGFVNRIGGKDETIHVGLDVDGRQVSGCYTSRAVAKELGHALFEPVRLFGHGRWSRDGDGRWTLEDFKIESFEQLKAAPLAEALSGLRALPATWDDDSYNQLKLIRHGRPKGNPNGGH